MELATPFCERNTPTSSYLRYSFISLSTCIGFQKFKRPSSRNFIILSNDKLSNGILDLNNS